MVIPQIVFGAFLILMGTLSWGGRNFLSRIGPERSISRKRTFGLIFGLILILGGLVAAILGLTGVDLAAGQ